jgi:uncharacterized protein (DUF1697 family)
MMGVFIALLRAIGPATHARMSMQALREGCEAAGLKRVTTYIQTGNVIFESRRSAAAVQAIVAGVVRSFGLTNDVVLRRPDELAAVIAADPFPDAAAVRPSALAVCFLAAPPDANALARLVRHPGPERVAHIGRDLCIDYPAGISGAKLTPGVVERRLAVVATARNWNTVRKLLAMAPAHDG